MAMQVYSGYEPPVAHLHCPHLGTCGGCVTTHSLTSDGTPLVISKKTKGFRHRLLLRVRVSDGGLKFGFFARGGREFVRVKQCAVATPLINELLNFLDGISLRQSDEERYRFIIDQVLGENNEPALIVTVERAQPNVETLPGILAALQSQRFVLWAGEKNQGGEAPCFAYDEDFGVRFYLKPGLFRQSHRDMNATLRRYILSKCENLGIKSVLDLYSGSGNLSLGFAKTCERLTLVENHPFAETCVRKSVSGIGNQLRFFRDDAAFYIAKNFESAAAHDLLICDPPRAGLGKAAGEIIALSVKYIYYVSCHPAQAVVDLRQLSEHYEMIDTATFDMFPFTERYEMAVLLRRRDV